MSSAQRRTVTAPPVLEGGLQDYVSVVNNPAAPPPGSNFWSWIPFAAEDFDSSPPPLPPGILPEVKISDFARYMNAVGSRVTEQVMMPIGPNAGAVPRLPSPQGRVSLSKGEGLVAAMRQVPSIYFKEGFSFDSRDLWATELVETAASGDVEAPIEKLSTQLDTVEGYLVSEIEARKDSFFDASKQVQHLGSVVKTLSEKVAAIKSVVGSLDNETSAAVDTSLTLQRRRKNLQSALNMLESMEGVAEAQDALTAVLPTDAASEAPASTDIGGMLDILDVLKAVSCGKNVLDLRCFSSLSTQTQSAMSHIERVAIGEIVQRTRFTGAQAAAAAALYRLRTQIVAGRDLGDRLISRQAVGRAQWKPDDDNDLERLQAHLHQGLLGPMSALKRLGRGSAAFTALKDASKALLKGALENAVEACLDLLLPASTTSTPYSEGIPYDIMDSLWKLSGEHFQMMLEVVLLTSMAHLDHCHMVAEAMSCCFGGGGGDSDQSMDSFKADCCRTLAETAAARWSKLLSARSGAVTVSPASLATLKDILAVTDILAGVAESFGVRSVAGLKTALQTLCKATLDYVHNNSLSRLNAILDHEQWVQVKVSSRTQQWVDALLECGGPNAAAVADSVNSAVQSSEVSDVLVIHGQEFHVVQSVVLLLGLFADYVVFKQSVPGFAYEVAHRVLEILKVFNQKSCHLVLGAGAMSAAGLRSITAKHLALACCCVDSLAALHPALTSVCTSGIAGPREEMMRVDYGKVAKDLEKHSEEICSKLVSIMKDRLDASARQIPILAATWIEGAVNPPASALATTTSRQLHILGNVLSELLPEKRLQSVITAVAEMTATTVLRGYCSLNLKSSHVAAQTIIDIQEISRCLRSVVVPSGNMIPSGAIAAADRLDRFIEEQQALQHAVDDAMPPLIPGTGDDSFAYDDNIRLNGGSDEKEDTVDLTEEEEEEEEEEQESYLYRQEEPLHDVPSENEGLEPRIQVEEEEEEEEEKKGRKVSPNQEDKNLPDTTNLDRGPKKTIDHPLADHAAKQQVTDNAHLL